VQEPYDPSARHASGQWILHQSAEDPVFTAAVLFMDESCFSRTRMTNIHNEHMWWGENPYATQSHFSSDIFSSNLWAGILGDCLIGPRILLAQVSGCNYLNFLWTHFSGLLEDVSFSTYLHMWF
jgi:disulfide bond formation protein DsbB